MIIHSISWQDFVNMGAKNVCVITDKKASWCGKPLESYNKLILNLFWFLVESTTTSISSSGLSIYSWSET
jgi:hypothetical protein